MCQSSRTRNYLTAQFGLVLLASALIVPRMSHAPNVAAPEPVGVSDAATPLPVAKPVDPRAYVAARASRHGWTVMQWKCAARLVQRESGWRVDADNPNSSAYGLFQFLHMRKGTPLHKQVDQFLRYVESRYAGNPCAALQHSLEKGWY